MLTDPPVYRLKRGNAPLLISIPHSGTAVPEWLRPRLLPEASWLPDTDWFVDQLYDFAVELDVTILAASYTRYVVDLNRPPDDTSLYPGRHTTGLCPIESFDGKPLYAREDGPQPEEMSDLVSEYWQPYHQALQSELARLRALHGQVILWDAHSIRSRLPKLFEGELPCLNIGTADQHACAPAYAAFVADVAEQSGYSWVLNGRFKGGYITRHYGQPASGIHAIQMEIAQRAYLQERSALPRFDTTLATLLRSHLRRMLEGLIDQVSHDSCQIPA